MGNSYLVMPTHAGWLVEWETGETIRIGGKEKKRHGNYETTDKKKAEEKAAQLNAEGYKNVNIMECIF